MAKLTKDQRRAIDRALYHAKRARTYIMGPDVALCMRAQMATTALHYTRADGKVLYEVTRDYGSDLCGLDDAIRELERLYTEAP